MSLPVGLRSPLDPWRSASGAPRRPVSSAPRQFSRKEAAERTQPQLGKPIPRFCCVQPVSYTHLRAHETSAHL
eukprot:1007543-Alexandrium_andersonii.AAC.1